MITRTCSRCIAGLPQLAGHSNPSSLANRTLRSHSNPDSRQIRPSQVFHNSPLRQISSADSRSGQAVSPDSRLRQSANNFANACLAIQSNLSQKQVTKSETWGKLFALMKLPQHADSAFELLLQDAAVREEVAWDWVTHGYGKTIIEFVEAAARAGAYDVGAKILKSTEALHITVNTHFIPNMMRKVLLGKPNRAAPLERLFELEKEIRGSHSGEGAYELARCYRLLNNAFAVAEVLTQANAEGLVIRKDFTARLLTWVEKRVDLKRAAGGEFSPLQAKERRARKHQ